MQPAVAMVYCLLKLVSPRMRGHKHVRDAEYKTSGKRLKVNRVADPTTDCRHDTFAAANLVRALASVRLASLILPEVDIGMCTMLSGFECGSGYA